MHFRSKRLSGLIVLAAAGMLVLGACSTGTTNNTPQSSAGFTSCEKSPNTCNTGPTKKGGSLVIALEKTVPNWNVNTSEGNTYDTAQIMNGMAPTAFIANPDSTIGWNKDLFADEPKLTSTSPETVVYHINPKATWDDGTPISADDFIFQWKTQNGKDCPTCEAASTVGYDLVDSVTGSDSGKTVTVVYKSPFADWQSLFGPMYPAHLAAKAPGADLTTPAGLAKAFNSFVQDAPTWSGGPYKIFNYEKDVSVTLVPNDKWYGSVKPSLDKIIFRVISDQPQEVPALQNNEVQLLYAQPSPDIVQQVRGIPGVMYNLSKGPTWEHIDANLKNKYLADKALREAIFTAIDRKKIIEKTVGPFFPAAVPLNNHNIMVGQPGYQDVITPTGQGAGNVEKARQILKDAGYTGYDTGALKDKTGAAIPALRFSFTAGNTLRQQSGEVVQQELKEIGLNITLTPIKSLGGTLEEGDFDLIIYAWVGTPFLSGSQQLWATDAGGNYGHYSNTQVDDLMKKAVAETSLSAEAKDFNEADVIMAGDAYVLPLYQKPVFLAVYDSYINVRNNPTSNGFTYNIQEWGLKETAK